MSTPPIPHAMIEAAAPVLAKYRDTLILAAPDEREAVVEGVTIAMLTAALEVCQVFEQWGAHLWYDGEHDDGFDTWLAGRTWAEARVESHARHRAANPPEENVTARRWHGNARLIRRLSITTPAEPVDTEEADRG